ncbi:uncharacterized protein EKO05_0008831 [Ascochyta rabiei]|uniref:uncharacterized protein n=1 Tax=Didymella rabiei TaxID=5454 RepID=UPI0021FADF0F|nr:uncharacterized protein EKO05_0008831 [Ascochyta rabiei]UPX18534.1 hypothetical protein EKO05_0008831 [Ascochyta rabiei]
MICNMADGQRAGEEKPKRARVRSGCMQCRTKRRKCDEAKPVCGRCKGKKEACQWGTRIVFREENNHGLSTLQLLPKHKTSKSIAPGGFQIQDITAEVIREQQHREEVERSALTIEPASAEHDRSPRLADEAAKHFDAAYSWETAAAVDQMLVASEVCTKIDDNCQQSLFVGNTGTANPLPVVNELSYEWSIPTALGSYDDSIFLPGSAYLDAHSTLRSHLIQEVNISSATRTRTPELPQDDRLDMSGLGDEFLNGHVPLQEFLTDEDEYALLENWVEELSPWLDKFDDQRHFQHTLPIMARSHAHLRFSILATSARQLERKERNSHTERSLALYQKAIQLVLPELHTRSTPVIASCVVLCVLEMQSSSPKAWRQHLDGCAHLIQASGINGFSGGVKQALFWCFARMDVCGGLITSMSTLIPMTHWASGLTLDDDTNLFRKTSGFSTYACYAVYLCGHVLDLSTQKLQLASHVGVSPNTSIESSERTSLSYSARWTELWGYIDDWYRHRPDEMQPIASVLTESCPFPKILYSNPAAISGNQLHHTTSILMLQHKPSSMMRSPRARSILWHARQICAISITNHHHGAWTNSIQPLWIAGQWLSNPSEQQAILDVLERIEKETGWGTKWRVKDLKTFWGNRDHKTIVSSGPS